MSGSHLHRGPSRAVRAATLTGALATAGLLDAALPGRSADPVAGLGPSTLTELGIPALILFGAGAIAAVALRRVRRPAGSDDGVPGRGREAGSGAAEAASPPPAPLIVTPDGLESRYGLPTCRAVAARMTDELLDRSETLFRLLVEQGRVDSEILARGLRAQPGAVAGLVSTPLTKLLRDVGLPAPYDQAEDPARRRRIWIDRDGAATRMLAAIRDEQLTRPAFTSRLSANFGNIATVDDAPAAFDALTDFLAIRVAEDDIALTLADIEDLVGEPLPRSARSQPRWWANRTDGPGRGQAAAWLTAGRRADPELAAGRVVFHRVA